MRRKFKLKVCYTFHGTTGSRCRSTPIADNYSHVYPILIHESNASVLKQLHEAGFSMSMTKKGLEVSKY